VEEGQQQRNLLVSGGGVGAVGGVLFIRRRVRNSKRNVAYWRRGGTAGERTFSGGGGGAVGEELFIRPRVRNSKRSVA
jgi:hypothetical protein